MDANQIAGLILLILLALFIGIMWKVHTSFYHVVGGILFLLIFIAICFRVIIPIANGTHCIIPTSEVQFKNWINAIPKWESIYHSIWIPQFIFWLILALFVRKCSNCGSFKYAEINRQKIKQYSEKRQQKDVVHSGDKTFEEYFDYDVEVSVYEVSFNCNKCDQRWTEIIKKEKNGSKRLTNKIRIK